MEWVFLIIAVVALFLLFQITSFVDEINKRSAYTYSETHDILNVLRAEQYRSLLEEINTTLSRIESSIESSLDGFDRSLSQKKLQEQLEEIISSLSNIELNTNN